MKIYLARHGETTGDVEGRFGGDYDDHLTQRGREQAKELGKALADKGLEIILHSPRIRAAETAEIVSALTGVSKAMIHDLRERNNYGVLTGLTKSEAAQKFPSECAKIERDKTFHDVRGSEPYNALWKRVKTALDDICRRPHRRLAVVTHGGVMRSIAREILDHPDSEIGDCGIIELDHDGGAYRLLSLTNVGLRTGSAKPK